MSFHSLVPIPAKVLAAGYDKAGWDWEFAHWGRQWGACHVQALEERMGGALYAFDTAWSPPVHFLRDVSRRWPSLEFVLEYDEPMLGLCGTARAQAGKFSRARRG